MAGNESATQSYQHDQGTCEYTDVQNWTDEKIAEEMLYSTLETIKITVIAPFIFTVGFVGNMAFFLLLARVKTMRTLTNFYLANLAVADVLVLMVKTRYFTSTYRQSILVWSEPFRQSIGCVLTTFACALSFTASFLLITFITLDRYFAICKPVQYRLMKNKKRFSFIVITFIWIISAAVSSSFVMIYGELVFVCVTWPSKETYDNFPAVGHYCGPIYPALEDTLYIVLTVILFTILVTNSALYIKIMNKLKQPVVGNGKKPNQNIKQRVTRMLLANSVIFFSCLCPTQLLFLLGNFLEISDAHKVRMRNTAYILIMVNSAVNPIIYGVASPSYRRGFLKAFGLAKNQVEPSEDQETKTTKTSFVK